MRRNYRFLGLFIIFLFLSGCFASVTYQGGEIGGRVGGILNSPGGSSSSGGHPAEGSGDIIGTGKASWYGEPFHGRETASGEIYDMWEMTAAHRTLPMGTRLVVERISNGKAVEVRVNDRGPYVDGRILDLSKGAADQLNMLNDGVAQVRLYHVGGPAPETTKEPTKISSPGQTGSEGGTQGHFSIQVGAFSKESNAETLRASLSGEFEDVQINLTHDGLYRVRVGEFSSQAEAQVAEKGLQALGHETWIVRVED